MKNQTHFLLAILPLALAGCVVSIGGRHESEPRTERVIVVPAQAEDRPLIAEIDAVAALNFEASRLEALKGIARRPELTPAAQVHLVNATFSKLDFDASQIAILETLIQNPSFSNTAKEAILAQVRKLDFEASRAAILKAINKRGSLEQ